jgi:hypothetical protein
MTNIIDRFAQIEAEYKAIKALYEDAKKEVLDLCYASANADMKATVAGDLFAAEFSLTSSNVFSAEKAKAFLTADQIEACKTQQTRQNLKVKLLAKTKVLK